MSEELTSWTGLLLDGARIPVREPWSTPSTMIRCMMAWALTEEAASARAETTDILSGYERELKEWDSVFFTSSQDSILDLNIHRFETG
ncbi:hypothetical protein KCU86_g15, partial [Aureobasidium melanogenum]